MLSIQVQAFVGHEHGVIQKDLDEEGLVLVRPTEGRLESPHGLDDVAAHEHAANPGHRRPAISEGALQQARRLDERVGSDTDVAFEVPIAVLAPVRPAVPILGRAVDHARVRMRLERRNLIEKLLRQPDIIGVQECDVSAASVGDSQVARCAHAQVLVLFVLDIGPCPDIVPRPASPSACCDRWNHRQREAAPSPRSSGR